MFFFLSFFVSISLYLTDVVTLFVDDRYVIEHLFNAGEVSQMRLNLMTIVPLWLCFKVNLLFEISSKQRRMLCSVIQFRE